MAQAAFHVLAGLALLATLAPFSRRPEWWIRDWDFPRLQIAAFTAAVVAGQLWAGSITQPTTLVVVTALVASLGYQLSVIWPYTRLWRTELKSASSPDPSRTVRLVVANVLMENRECERLFEQFRRVRPDVILALETDEWWCRRLAAFSAEYAFTVAHPLENTYGMFLASRLNLREPEVRFLWKEDIPSIRCGISLPSGETVEFFAVHPEPPAPGEADTATNRDAELILIAREVAKEARPAIVAGDLNDVAWSHTSRRFRRLCRMLDPRRGRGFFNSFHAQYPFLRWPLDHVFVTPDFALVEIRRLEAFGSDHFPIYVALEYAPHLAPEQQEPEPDQEDHEEARQTLRDRSATPRQGGFEVDSSGVRHL